MTTLKIALLLSMLFQIVATILAISLIRRTRFNISWILISCAFILMALRRLFEFSGFFWESKLFPNDELNGWIGVLISVFIFIGVIFIKKIFNLQDEIEKLRAENENKVLSAIINTEEKARQSFARELHDGMGPVLSSIKMTLSAVNNENLTPVNRKIIESAHHAASNSIITLKEIANNLSPHLLTNYGLKQALETLASQLFPQKNIGYEFDFQIEEKQLSEEMSINLYRILSELINNSFVHANPQKVYVEIKEKGAFVQVRYMDDGIGFNYDSGNEKVKNKGMGLNNIFSRVKSLNGYYTITTAPENGFLIEFFFPL
ncbi:Signal transduction histidine kinase [Tangfeifania diversioriginum]|uniref:Signal transduction histidine kinase n=1 Tax=Tangfeifania diversioriginum TaxID=1168035 RepID=A0A1M6H5C9_9BACT|nr:ATP-binding protein [Tangfeifania diversioriginum]SHJ17393.1 Signal transduction histidine kinase [Tangfeifania diversioriginum]